MIIGSLRTYVGDVHPGLRGEVVQIVAILRGASADDHDILTTDELIGEIRPDDIVEVAPIILGEEGSRPSFPTSDARPDHLVAPGGEAS